MQENKIIMRVLQSPVLVGDCAWRGLQKGDYSDIPKAGYLRCEKTIDRLS